MMLMDVGTFSLIVFTGYLGLLKDDDFQAMRAQIGVIAKEAKMSDLHGMRISKHAALRCAQRGVSAKLLAALIESADIEVSAGNGAYAVSVSRLQVAALNLPRKLGRYTAIISDDATLVTVAPVHDGRRGRRWRRGRSKGRGRG